MGLANARIQLRNPRLPELEPVEVEAPADTGSVHLCIPQHIQIQLKQAREYESGQSELKEAMERLEKMRNDPGPDDIA
jgi:cell division septal protein FtsQ